MRFTDQLSLSCCVNKAHSPGCVLTMTAPVYLVDGSPLRDPLFTAVISERMRVPDRLRVAQTAVEDLKASAEDLPPAFSMHVPDRLALTDAPDLSPRPLFSQHNARGHASSLWNLRQGPWDRETFTREHAQSPLRRSYSDQTFGRTPSGTPTHSKHFSSGTTQEVWRSPEEESGTTVELIVLRRQMMKMNRRIASLEKQNAERKQSELVLFSLLLSACLINGWLWIRK
ncbi:mitochondrial fission factor-like isoform X3 [Hemibagrus wyckioides]|uniref:mitochondrial fission factor-like isoform X3 n=1 Tax=Hemibagrus wyckioides TaxID=337641 RepID=UPI00266B8885|nr:mitochondrial fission factor-like isoform X3 [Hemibagrus wyckioides]